MCAERISATMDLGGWLRSLGLGQYEAAFLENAIDDTVLPNLTAEDLKDLGVSIVGHRRKLLDAITALRAIPGTRPDAVDSLGRRPGHAGERRQVTVMFSDLVGSTALSGRMDPEDLQNVLSAYRGCVAEAASRHGGYVAKYLGDGALIYFGYPEAREDDAQILQIVRGQIREDRRVDGVVAERRLVIAEAEVAQPCPNIHRRAVSTPRAASFRRDDLSRFVACRDRLGRTRTDNVLPCSA